MKKVISVVITAFLLLFFMPSLLNAEENTDKTSTSVTDTEELAKINALVERFTEIKAMDIPALEPAEKKALRKELRSIKSELKTISKNESNSPAISEAAERGGGLYLSVGAIIIIILLLILLL